MNPIKKNSGQSDEHSPLTYKILKIRTDDRELIVVDANEKTILTEVYIIIELPSGEFISGPYSKLASAERDLLKIELNGN
ncbi:hypothetical protein N6P31_20755 [Pectobacterium betavasculorum]|uniref:hypothetical protein n=1 Tax=Pectobacterium betavasculorum TaxID=55207 RepID=UPI00313D3892